MVAWAAPCWPRSRELTPPGSPTCPFTGVAAERGVAAGTRGVRTRSMGCATLGTTRLSVSTTVTAATLPRIRSLRTFDGVTHGQHGTSEDCPEVRIVPRHWLRESQLHARLSQ